MGAETVDGLWVGDIGDKERNRRRGVGMSCPLEGFGQFGGVSTGESKRFERKRWVEEFESFSNNVLASETSGAQDYEIVRRAFH